MDPGFGVGPAVAGGAVAPVTGVTGPSVDPVGGGLGGFPVGLPVGGDPVGLPVGLPVGGDPVGLGGGEPVGLPVGLGGRGEGVPLDLKAADPLPAVHVTIHLTPLPFFFLSDLK